MGRLKGNESGVALLVVLILLALGLLIIAPLMAYMSTGLNVGKVYEERMLELYAADGGIEDGLWKLMHNQIPEVQPYILTLNEKTVAVTVGEGMSMEEFFIGMLDLPPGQASAQHPHGTGEDEWLVVSAAPEPGTYEINAQYIGKAENKAIRHLGAWLYGDIYIYKEGSASGITTAPPTTIKDYCGGTAFLWDLDPDFWFGKKTGIYEATQTFQFTLADGSTPIESPQPSIGWVGPQSNDIWISWEGAINLTLITATATDPATNKSTTVESYVIAQQVTPLEPLAITIVSWEISQK